MINLQLNRIVNGADSTLGYLQYNKEYFSFTLEDEGRNVKVAGETRIPAGTYRILFREILSPATERYRKKYSWFKWHLELQDVPGFKYVYIHVGNTDDDTDACILTGTDTRRRGVESLDFDITQSTPQFERLYKRVRPELEKGTEVYITIIDP